MSAQSVKLRIFFRGTIGLKESGFPVYPFGLKLHLMMFNFLTFQVDSLATKFELISSLQRLVILFERKMT